MEDMLEFFGIGVNYWAGWAIAFYTIFNAILLMLFRENERRSRVYLWFVVIMGLILPLLFMLGSIRCYVLDYCRRLPDIDRFFWDLYHMVLILYVSIITSVELHSILRRK